MRFGLIDNFVLFGGGQRLVNFVLAAQGFRIVVVSAPRLLSGKLDNENITVKDYFEREKISYISVESLDAMQIDQYINARTLAISFGAPWIFRKNFIEKFQGRLINGHGTILPKNRGAATFCWQIMRGDHAGAHLFHLVDEGVDSGPIILMRTFEFPESCRTPQGYREFYIQGEIEFFKGFLEKLRKGDEFTEIMQDEEQSTYFPRLSTVHHGWMDWSWSAKEIERFICAFDEPHEGASTLLDGKRVFLKNAVVDASEGVFHPFMSGLIIRVRPEYAAVAVRDGVIRIGKAYDEGGNAILGNLRVGSRFVTPTKYLDDARAFKAVYTPRGLKEY